MMLVRCPLCEWLLGGYEGLVSQLWEQHVNENHHDVNLEALTKQAVLR